MKEFIKLFSLVLIIVSTLFSQRNYSFGWHIESIEVDKLERHFRIFIPRDLQNETPLVLIFHTSNSGMENVFNTGDGFNEWANLAEREKLILVIPNGVNPINGDALGTNQKWNDCRKSNIESEQLPRTDDVNFIKELINWSIENLKINEKQIYAAGIGNGGMMVYRLAFELGDVLSGAAVFFANLPVDSECSHSGHVVPSVKYGLLSSHPKDLLGNQNRDIEGVVEAWKFLRRFSK